MAAAGHLGEDARSSTPSAPIGMRAGARLGIAIPVGKDSCPCERCWTAKASRREKSSPLSLIVQRLRAGSDVRRALTPELAVNEGDTSFFSSTSGAGRTGSERRALA